MSSTPARDGGGTSYREFRPPIDLSAGLTRLVFFLGAFGYIIGGSIYTADRGGLWLIPIAVVLIGYLARHQVPYVAGYLGLATSITITPTHCIIRRAFRTDTFAWSDVSEVRLFKPGDAKASQDGVVITLRSGTGPLSIPLDWWRSRIEQEWVRPFLDGLQRGGAILLPSEVDRFLFLYSGIALEGGQTTNRKAAEVVMVAASWIATAVCGVVASTQQSGYLWQSAAGLLALSLLFTWMLNRR